MIIDGGLDTIFLFFKSLVVIRPSSNGLTNHKSDKKIPSENEPKGR
jgi:hypothetical protein